MPKREIVEEGNPETGTVIHEREVRPRPELGRGHQKGRDGVLRAW